MAQDWICFKPGDLEIPFLLWSFGCKENAKTNLTTSGSGPQNFTSICGQIFGAGSMEPSVINQQISDVFHDINEYDKPKIWANETKPPKITNILAIKVAGCFSSFFTNFKHFFHTTVLKGRLYHRFFLTSWATRQNVHLRLEWITLQHLGQVHDDFLCGHYWFLSYHWRRWVQILWMFLQKNPKTSTKILPRIQELHTRNLQP